MFPAFADVTHPGRQIAIRNLEYAQSKLQRPQATQAIQAAAANATCPRTLYIPVSRWHHVWYYHCGIFAQASKTGTPQRKRTHLPQYQCTRNLQSSGSHPSAAPSSKVVPHRRKSCMSAPARWPCCWCIPGCSCRPGPASLVQQRSSKPPRPHRRACTRSLLHSAITRASSVVFHACSGVQVSTTLPPCIASNCGPQSLQYTKNHPSK